MSKSTFKILFYLRKNYVNKEGKASIMIRITVNGEMSQFSSKTGCGASSLGHQTGTFVRERSESKAGEQHA